MTRNPNDAGTFRWESPTGGTSPDGSSATILPCGRWWYIHRGEGESKPDARGTTGGQEAIMEARAARLRDEEAKARKGGEGA
jgi:hypothetical protein